MFLVRTLYEKLVILYKIWDNNRNRQSAPHCSLGDSLVRKEWSLCPYSKMRMNWIAIGIGCAAYLTMLYCHKNQRKPLSAHNLYVGWFFLFYCGIDIEKHNHETSIIDAEEKALLDSISFADTRLGARIRFPCWNG